MTPEEIKILLDEVVRKPILYDETVHMSCLLDFLLTESCQETSEKREFKAVQ